jgi:hypothetical protein
MKTNIRCKYVRAAVAVASFHLATSSVMGAIQSSWHASSGALPTDVSPAWTLIDNASPEDPKLEPLVAPEFLTLSTSGELENMWYALEPPAVDLSGSFYIEAVVRFVSGTSSHLARAPILIGFTTAPDVGNILFIGPDKVFFNSANFTIGASASVDTDGAFHTYRIEVTSTGSISLHYDGDPLLIWHTVSDFDLNGSQVRVRWGEGSLLAQGTSQWKSFVVADLPEPSMLLVFGGVMGTAYLLAASRSQRHPCLCQVCFL